MTAIANLPWRGAETITSANAILASHRDVELRLPAGYHHAVVAHFASDASSDGDRIDIVGGAELLEALAQIQGLDGLAQLEQIAQQERARIRVLSPSPTVVIRVAPEASV